MTTKQFLILIRVLIAGFNAVCETMIMAHHRSKDCVESLDYTHLLSDSHFMTDAEIKAMESEA